MTYNRKYSRGFTLVELLVVIGIIALLISILLPSLQSARKSANSVKCMTQQREIGNAFRFYSLDFKEYYPPSQINPSGTTYNLYGDDFPILGYGAYWFNFINQYVTSGKVGLANRNDADAGGVKNGSVIWGCPEWQGFYRNSSNDSIDFNRIQPGYGMNAYPTFDNDNYVGGFPPNSERAYNFAWNGDDPGRGFIKSIVWGKKGSERMLLSDCRLWLAESGPIPDSGELPPMMGEFNKGNQLASQTYVSVFRHGELSEPDDSTAYSYKTTGGKVSFNILYSDGHVAASHDLKEAYKSLRMKFPG